MVAALSVLLLLGGGGAAWWLLAPQPTAPAPVATSALIALRCSHQRLRAQVDGGAWQAVGPAGLSVPSGNHTITVEADQPGPLLRWSGSVEAAAAARTEVPVVLSPIAVPETTLELPGAGMLYRCGAAFGLEQTVRIAQAGRWPLGRWDGRRWQERTFTVDAQGHVEPGTARDGDRPGGEAWWQVSDDDGMPLPSQHLVCWWEAEAARQAGGLPEPSGWREQAARPAQPARGLDAILVQGVVERIGGVAVTDRDQAAACAVRFSQPVWFRDARGRLSLVGGGSATVSGLLVLVPDSMQQAP